MMIMQDPRLFEPLLSSNEQADIDILNGIIEAYWKGNSKQGILEFRMVYPNQEIIYHVTGQQASIGVSKEIAHYLKDTANQTAKNR